MNWKKEAIEDLKRYVCRKEGCLNVADRIQTLNSRLSGVRGANTDAVPNHGGGSKVEEWRINTIMERDRLKINYASLKKLVQLTERGLAQLTDDERRVLEKFFIHRGGRHVDELMEELCYEKTRIYELKDEALYKFTVAMYGMIES
ncbi:MAG: hypothetical protein IJW78_04280 [Clostridia bacterium]|nr:hypothetical protein [Clostridia bacterium]